MRILVFDPFHGAAGDMITGSLIDLGADRELVVKAMSSVVASPDINRVDRCGISAIKVITNSQDSHRTPEEVNGIIERADAPKEVIDMAKRIFERIARGETGIHGEHVHFHEVGADDAIADIIGACTAFISLNVDAVTVLPVATGTGHINSAHGRYPNPAPATLAILSEGNIPVRITDEEAELCTPTGAAILSEFNTGSYLNINGLVQNIGYGAGSRDPKGIPNVTRAYIINTTDPCNDIIDVLETNVDDVTGEIIAYVIQRLLDAGAADACAIPAVMKKGRPGYVIKVICRNRDDVPEFIKILTEELGTLGIRHMQNVHRSILDRKIIEVPYPHGNRTYSIRVKAGYIDKIPVTVKAEFEDVRRVASECRIPIRTVAKYAEEECLKVLKNTER